MKVKYEGGMEQSVSIRWREGRLMVAFKINVDG